LVFYSSLPCGRAKQIVPALFSKILWDGCVKGKTNQHAGKRGVLGVVVIIFGLWMMIGAKKDAGDVAKTYFQSGQQGGFVGLAADNALAKTAGYDSMEDYMAEQNRSSGLFCICVGVGLTVWGYKKYYNSPVQTK
jgi:uncharacterized membrane protein YidH (DUF202 family)